MEYEPQVIEDKWRSRWRETGRYEADPDDRPGTFVTVPYPYPSGGMHIGHARTYTVPDAYARFRRHQGDNVLFPIAWHVTGTPIVGAVERLKKGEKEQLRVLTDVFGVPEEDLQELETPMGYARYFIEQADCSYKAGMQSLGLSIDWRREFTTNDDRYSAFISWQYEKLRANERLEKGMHPVKFCTNEEQPVTTHDLLKGEDAEFQEYTLIRFEWDGLIVPMATLRPETVHGVTNAFIDPDAEYVIGAVDDEQWFMSAAAAEKFELQGYEVSIDRTVSGEFLVGEHVVNPVTGDDVLVLPATFVEATNATGVVMSVPAHSPDDWVALADAKADPAWLETYGIDPDEVASIEPRGILTIEGFGEYPAQDIVGEYEVDSQDDPRLKDATQSLYQREFNEGRLAEMYGEFAGEVVRDVRDRFRDKYRDEGVFDTMYEFTEVVVCRCGGDVEVATQETWFLRYNDPSWKSRTKDVVDGLETIPENTRGEYLHTIDWLKEWPCIRNYGLGTRLPWDSDFVIEPLSDSTIYMSYYTFSHEIQDVPLGVMDTDFFDTVFDGESSPATLDDDALEHATDLQAEWEYWYPVDFRCSANDLISNHLTFYLFHHADLFAEDKWPQGITVMGMGLLDGERMSSSKGHVVLPGEAIERFGADTVRFFLLNSAEPWQDYNWRAEEVQTARNQVERFWNRAINVIYETTEYSDISVAEDGRPYRELDGEREYLELERIDHWLRSKTQGIIRDATEAMDQFETRSASQAAFYDVAEHLRWYRKRTDLDRPTAKWLVRDVLQTQLVLIAPFVPFIANELYEQLTGSAVDDASWPVVTSELESDRIEAEEELIRDLGSDIREVIDVTNTDPETIRIYIAADWKYSVFSEILETGQEIGAVMGQLMQDNEMQQRGNAVNQVVSTLIEYVREHPTDRLSVLKDIDETSVVRDAASYFANEFDAEVDVYPEEDADDPGNKAKSAVPFRPAIYIE